MPAANGEQAIARSKSKHNLLTRDIPVIVITAFLGGALVDGAIAVPAAVLHKPVNFKWLIS